MNDTRDLPTLDQLRTRRQMLVGATAALTSLGMGSISALAHIEEEVSRTAESIHQEPVFKANPKRVYEALTDEKQFERVTLLSAAMQSGMAPGNKRTQIGREAGGPFTLFGGHLVCRHIELGPNERIVQAWRGVEWTPGIYSLVECHVTEEERGAEKH